MYNTRFKVFHYFCTSSFDSVINSTVFYLSHAGLLNLVGYVALYLEKKKARSYSSDIEGLLVSNKSTHFKTNFVSELRN